MGFSAHGFAVHVSGFRFRVSGFGVLGLTRIPSDLGKKASTFWYWAI